MLHNSSHIALLNKWVDGMGLNGGKDDLGFMFIYELMTGSIQFKIIDSDSTYQLGCLLLRLLPAKEHQEQGLLISILRVLSKNQALATHPSILVNKLA